MSDTPFPQHDFSRYAWRASSEGKLEREAAGGEYIEDVYNRYNHGEQNLFLGVEVTLSAPLDVLELVERARDAWIELRFSLPTIAAHTEHNEAGFPLITYRAANGITEVQEWADRTLILSSAEDIDQLRYELGKKSLPDENGDQTFMHVVPYSPTSVGFLLHTSHIPFDGAGTKILITRFLRRLANSSSSKVPRAWGSEGQNLLPAATEVLGENEERAGPQYNRALGAVLSDLQAAMPRMYGFKKRRLAPGPTRRAHTTFTVEESLKILDASRSLGLTINHLAHGAVTLVCAMDNPPTATTSPEAEFVFYGLVDGRPRLAADYKGSKYAGYCLAMSAIQIPVKVLAESGAAGRKEQLLAAARTAMAEYVKQKAYPSLLAICPQQVDLMLSGMRAGESPPPPWMGPWFSGDGVGEKYLDPVYADARDGNAITVTNFFTSLNKTDPGPFFRCWSWGNRLTLSADYNENAMPKDVVEGFVNNWAQLLRLLL